MDHAAPLNLHREVILPEWIDYNGHMNLSYYVLVFDHATDAFLDYLGMTETFRAEHNCSTFSAEIHVNYIQEVVEGDEVYVTTQLLDYDEKRIHYFHRMYHSGKDYLSATNELMSLYMDMNQRKVARMPVQIQTTLHEIRQIHSMMPVPDQVGSTLAIPRR